MRAVSVRALIVPPAKARVATYVALEKYVARFARMPVFEREFRLVDRVAAPDDAFLDAFAALVGERGVVNLA